MQIAKRAAAAVFLLMLCLACIAPQALAQGSLIVRVTSPASGATVAGTTAVNASVSIIGLITVRGVQFKLDGANLGAEDTAAPYSVAWNTASAANGSHTLTAVARDLLGIRYTSGPVTIVVSNGSSDTTPPVVSISSPASGATVAGTINVTANASDNVGVAGVRFLADGTQVGAEDTAAPYAAAFDTTKVANGSHTLTARARDAAGNVATSAAVTVSVSNAPSTPPAVKRHEETEASVIYTAGWTQGDTSRTWSGASAAVSTTPGARATFAFSGPSVSWIGARGPQTGIARVFVDGVFVAEVDTYSKTDEVRVTMFEATGLADTSHTFAIEVTGAKNAAATSTVVAVDAFDVPAQTIARLQETDPDATYTAGWVQGNTLRAWSAGAAAVSATQGAQASFTFSGTSISWIGARGTQSGIARVFLDGAFVAEVDTYSPAEQIQAAVFTATDLADAGHTLMIEATGRKNAAADAALIIVDAFDVSLPGTRVQETDPAIVYGTGWIQNNRDKAYSGGTTAESVTPGAVATFAFSGTSIGWIGGRGPQTGIARVFLDGAFAAEIDTYFPTEGPQHSVFTATGLAPGNHTLTIEVTGRRNTASTDTWILIDAFDVRP